MEKKILFLALAFTTLVGGQLCQAQTIKSQIVENGGTGAYKAEVVADSTCPRFTIYRPQDLKAAVQAEGKLPVILYANGGCANNNVEMRYLLSEVASHGYVAIAIGPYDEDNVMAKWSEVLTFMYPESKGAQVTLANGEQIKAPTETEKKAIEEHFRKQMEKERKSAGEKKKTPVPQPTYPRMLLEALDWLTDQNANPTSEYYHALNLDEVAAMGQSCGGAQALAVAHDPRITTCVILNSGIGDMTMQGATKEALNSLHTPMLYLIGGPEDVAYPNAQKDFEHIKDMPVVMINTLDGHSGTYYEKSGGSYAVAVRKWLDWQLKDNVGQSALFLDPEYGKTMFPDWTVVRKNFK